METLGTVEQGKFRSKRFGVFCMVTEAVVIGENLKTECANFWPMIELNQGQAICSKTVRFNKI